MHRSDAAQWANRKLGFRLARLVSSLRDRVFRLPPFFANLGKRLIRAPKLYFYDSGLAASLLHIESPRQLATHPLRGALFETWVVAEIAKAHLHRGRRPRLSFYRDRERVEVDLVIERGSDLVLVEIKSAQTPSAKQFAAIERLAATLAGADARPIADRIVVYGGGESQQRSNGRLLSWYDLDTADWTRTSAEPDPGV